jgi:hypothetical protein
MRGAFLAGLIALASASTSCRTTRPNTADTGKQSAAPKPQPPAGSSGPVPHTTESDTGLRPCGSAADCSANEICCLSMDEGLAAYCAKGCSSQVACSNDEDCGSGLSCRLLDGKVPTCQPTRPGTRCGEARCEGPTPICCWDTAANTGTCLHDGTECPVDGKHWTVHCSSAADCGSYHCCTGALPQTTCSLGCAIGIDTCSTQSECPKFLGPPTGCQPRDDGPPWLGNCEYGSD